MAIHLVCGSAGEPRARQAALEETEWSGPAPTHSGPWDRGRPVGKREPVTQDFSGDVVVLDTDGREGYSNETFIFEDVKAAKNWVYAIAAQIEALEERCAPGCPTSWYDPCECGAVDRYMAQRKGKADA